MSAGRSVRDSAFKTNRGVVLALLLLIAAVATQLVPLSESVINALSPARTTVDYQTLYDQSNLREVNSNSTHRAALTLSIAPKRTALGLAFLGSFSLLMIGCSRGLSATRPTALIRGIIILGVIAAFAEIMQKSSGSSIVYGLFTPRQVQYQSAPFVNRNHTAGWLLMVLGITLGHLAGCLARGMSGVGSNWRERLLWLSTRRASETVLTAFAAIVMAIAVVFTESRSGAACLVISALIFVIWSLRSEISKSRRLLTIM